MEWRRDGCVLFLCPRQVAEIAAGRLVYVMIASHKIFLGTDSAPHTQDAKESCCGCAGCFSHHAAIELYAQVFYQADALDKLEAFASINGPDFYGLPHNKSKITLQKNSWQLPDSISYEGSQLIPLGAGSSLNWELIG